MAMRKNIFSILGFLAGLLLLVHTVAAAPPNVEEFMLPTETVKAEGADRLNLNFSIAHARVTFIPTDDPTFLVKVQVHYENTALPFSAIEKMDDNAYYVRLESATGTGSRPSEPFDEWEVFLGKTDLPTQLAVNFTNVFAGMDLGGLALNNVALNFKGANIRLDFGSPAYFTIPQLVVSCKGTNLAFHNIGNSRFENFQLVGTASCIHLDFKGLYIAGDYNSGLSLNGSSAKVILPVETGVRLRVHTDLCPLEVTGADWQIEQHPDLPPRYRTSDYDLQESHINLDVNAPSSSVTVSREGKNPMYHLSY